MAYNGSMQYSTVIANKLTRGMARETRMNSTTCLHLALPLGSAGRGYSLDPAVRYTLTYASQVST